MHFPELWDEDSLIFDDTAERELLLRQFKELIGEISSDEGYHDFNSETCPFAILENKKGTTESTARNTLELPSIFSSPPTQQSHSICDWHADRIRGTTIRDILTDGGQGTSFQANARQHTRRYDVPEPEDHSGGLSLSDRLVQGSSLGREEALNKLAPGILSLSHSTEPEVVGIVKLPDGNYYMAMSDSPKQASRNADCNYGMSPLVASTAKSTPTSRSDLSIKPSLDSLSNSSKGRYSGGIAARITPKRLFSPDKNSRKTNTTRTPCKRARTYPHLPNPPRPSPNPKNEIPSDIMKDLEVIRIHRRSSYADGDSLVEVQPSSLPGSPTMFAYRDPEGRLRVPLDMQCNQQALATYKSMTPSKTTTPRVVSVCDVTQRQLEPTNVLEESFSGDSGSQSVAVTMRHEAIDQRTPKSLVNKGKKNDSLSARKIIEEWGKLRQHI